MRNVVETDIETLVQAARDALVRGDSDAAWQLSAQALEAGRDYVEVRQFLGFIARGRRDLDLADTHYAAALAMAPTDGLLHNNLAEVRHAQGHVAEALALYRRAAVLAPDRAEIAGNLGGILLTLHHPDQALPHLLRALSMNPDLINVNGDAGSCLCALNRYPESLQHYRAVYRVEPNNNSARYLEALALLALGDFENGWRKHECRWYASLGQEMRTALPEPYWLGDTAIEGKTILLHAEQGLGDCLQFVRYVPMVAERGARIVLAVQEPLQSLLASMPQVDRVISKGDIVPGYDVQCSLMSLPRAFRTRLDTIPAAVPYVAPSAAHVALWRDRLPPADGRRRIALAWSGTQTVWNRGIALERLRPLLNRPDCVFHVAQTDMLDTDRATLATLPDMVDHSGELTDFSDTAALLTHMDLVLSVDTVLAHLGGALARSTWTMLPLGADYRWLTDRTDSPWYPTMRLFRQPALHDWDGVVRAVDAALDALPS